MVVVQFYVEFQTRKEQFLFPVKKEYPDVYSQGRWLKSVVEINQPLRAPPLVRDCIAFLPDFGIENPARCNRAVAGETGEITPYPEN